MAELANQTSLVPVDGEYVVEVKEFDAAGKSTALKVALPTEADFNKWALMQQAVMLKKGMMKLAPISEIVWAIAYAHRKGLDIMSGDVFSTGEGRIGIANKAKIKMALATGNIVGIETDIRDTGEPISLAGCSQKTDLECTAKIHVKGWKVPIVKKARLSKWYMPKNPNWQGRPEYMLELNTVAHGCEYVNPTETGADEAPPLDMKMESSYTENSPERAKENNEQEKRS